MTRQTCKVYNKAVTLSTCPHCLRKKSKQLIKSDFIRESQIKAEGLISDQQDVFSIAA